MKFCLIMISCTSRFPPPQFELVEAGSGRQATSSHCRREGEDDRGKIGYVHSSFDSINKKKWPERPGSYRAINYCVPKISLFTKMFQGEIWATSQLHTPFPH